MWWFLCFGGRFSSLCGCCKWALLLWLHADKTLELGQNSLLFFFLPFDAGDGIGSPCISPTLPVPPLTPTHSSPADHQLHHHVPDDARASFVQLTVDASYSALSCCHCTVLWSVFVSSLHMSIYPGYSGLQDLKSSFYKSSGSSEEVW